MAEKEVEILSAEQAADLAALQSSVAETAPAAVEQEAPAGPVTNQADSWAVLPAMIGSMLAMALPEVKPCFSPEACQEWGEAMVPVAAEHGWDADEVLGPNMALAVATLPFIVGPVVAIKARKAAAMQAQIQAQARPGAMAEPGAGQKTIVFGSPDAK